MPINKFTTLLDLSRQSKIITGETATFDGKILAGIPFSGYPTGVNTATTVSLGVVSTENAVFSGNTGTTVFDVSNPLSPYYNPLFSGYTATTWTNPLFSATTSGLTLPITILSADTQVVGPFWTLTQTGYTGDYIIGTEYTGYSVTYSFFTVTQFSAGVFSGITSASQQNFSAGTLDYKGPLDYLSSKENISVDGRLITNKITITNGASSATTNYVLSQIDDTGKGGWNSVSSLLSGSCLPIVNLETINDCSSGITFNSDVTINGDVIVNGSATTINTEIIRSKDNNIILNYSGTHLTAIGGGFTLEDGVSNGVDSIIYSDSNGVWLFDPSLSASSGTIINFSADTIGSSGDCVNDLYVSNIHSCSPLNINPLDEGNVYFGSTSGVTIDVTNSRLGIGTINPSEKLHISSGDMLVENTNGKYYTDIQNTTGPLTILSGNSSGVSRIGVIVPTFDSVTLGVRGPSAGFPGYGKQGDAFIYSSSPNNGFNLISAPGTGTDDYIRFYAGINATSTPDIHIQGSGVTRGYVGIGTKTPTERLTVSGTSFFKTSSLTTGTSPSFYYLDGVSTPTDTSTIKSIYKEFRPTTTSSSIVVGDGTLLYPNITSPTNGEFYSKANLLLYTDNLSLLNNTEALTSEINVVQIQTNTGTYNDIVKSSSSVLRNLTAGGTINKYVGFWMNGFDIDFTHNGTTNNIYGFYMDDQSTRSGNIPPTSNRWGIYIDDDAKNYFAGSVGIGTPNPQYLLDVVNTNSRLFYNPTSAGGDLRISGNTNLPRMAISIAPYLTKPAAGGQTGMRCWDDTTSPGYGKVGDMFTYAGNASNGLNLINSPGSGTEDYIRFYAGQTANGSTPDIHIQGSGVTRGYVGIGTSSPSEKLDVNGKTKTTTLQVTSGSINGYVLVSDSVGNATWQSASGATSGVTFWTASTGVDAIVVKNSGSVASGLLSLAQGYQTTASGDTSHAEGYQTIAGGNFGSHAEGFQTTASGDFSHAEGADTFAIGIMAHSEGYFTSAIGDHSHAEGNLSTASGDTSHAEGFQTIASGDYSHSEGFQTTASGTSSHSEGWITTASGDYSHSEGYYNIASGTASHAEGGAFFGKLGLQDIPTSATTYSSHAEGIGTLASGQGSHAEGLGTSAIDKYSHSEGVNTLASGDASHAEGASTIASGGSSHAEGGDTLASGIYSHSEGDSTTASGTTSHAEGQSTIASGVGSHAEGYFTNAIGDYSHSEGYYNISSGIASHAEGGAFFGKFGLQASPTSATTYSSHAEGISTLASGDYSHAEGESTISSGIGSHAEGYFTQSIGGNSHTEGYQTTASGTSSHAEGINTLSLGQFSHAEGDNTTASGTSSHAEGQNTTSNGLNSHAEGQNTTSNGDGSHAEGENTTSSGVSSHSEGYQTLASGDYSHAEGYTNIASGIASHAEGGAYFGKSGLQSYPTSATTTSSHAEGLETLASGIGSHAEGRQTIASGQYSHAEGIYTSASGDLSHAEGNLTRASGNASHAEGYQTSATTQYSHSEGYETLASGQGSHAEGNQTSATTQYSHSEGGGTLASGNYSHSEGWITTASGNYSHSEGYYNIASGIASHAEGGAYFGKSGLQDIPTSATTYSSHAEGIGTLASGIGSHAEGIINISSGEGSHAEGNFTLASGQGSHAEGYITSATTFYSHSEGYITTASGYGSHAEGENTTSFGLVSHAEGQQTLSSGNASHAEGLSTTSSGNYSHAEGGNTLASGLYSHAEGYQTSATTSYSHSEGYLTSASGLVSHSEGTQTLASGQGSHAEGLQTSATASYTHAEGYQTSATTSYSHSEGYQTLASGIASHAEGEDTIAIGNYSHAEGSQTLSSGNASHAEGLSTTSSGNYSHAEGGNTLASGLYSHAEGVSTSATTVGSHAEGQGTIAYENYQHVSGKWNNTTNANQYFIIGRGTSNASRSNAFRVDSAGNVYGAGATYNSGADYAEYFESLSGDSIPYGTVVELVDDKIKVCVDANNAMGVISSNPTLIGNNEGGTADEWVGKYEKDEWGRYIMEDYSYDMIDYITESGETIYKTITEQISKLSQNFDPNLQYIPRSQRSEWNVVGLVGQVRVLKNQQIPSRWIKMKDINNDIALYLIR